MKPTWKSWFFLFCLSAILIAGGRIIGDRQGLMAGFLLALSINSVLYFWSDQILLALFETVQLEGQDSWGLQETLAQLARQVRIAIPKVYILNTDIPSAFALGRSPQHGTIVITEGVLRNFEQKELEAVLAYQVVAIRRQDTLLPAFAVTLFGGFLILIIAKFFDRLLSYTPFFAKQRSKLLTQFFSPITYLLFKLSISKKLFFDLDQETARLIADPLKLAKVLWKMDSFSLSKGAPIPPPTAPLFMVNPLTNSKPNRYFRLQPETSLRIKRLIGYYPI